MAPPVASLPSSAASLASPTMVRRPAWLWPESCLELGDWRTLRLSHTTRSCLRRPLRHAETPKTCAHERCRGGGEAQACPQCPLRRAATCRALAHAMAARLSTLAGWPFHAVLSPPCRALARRRAAGRRRRRCTTSSRTRWRRRVSAWATAVTPASSLAPTWAARCVPRGVVVAVVVAAGRASSVRPRVQRHADTAVRVYARQRALWDEGEAQRPVKAAPQRLSPSRALIPPCRWRSRCWATTP